MQNHKTLVFICIRRNNHSKISLAIIILRAVKSIAQEQGLNHLQNYPFDALMAIWDQAKKWVG